MSKFVPCPRAAGGPGPCGAKTRLPGNVESCHICNAATGHPKGFERPPFGEDALSEVNIDRSGDGEISGDLDHFFQAADDPSYVDVDLDVEEGSSISIDPDASLMLGDGQARFVARNGATISFAGDNDILGAEAEIIADGPEKVHIEDCHAGGCMWLSGNSRLVGLNRNREFTGPDEEGTADLYLHNSVIENTDSDVILDSTDSRISECDFQKNDSPCAAHVIARESNLNKVRILGDNACEAWFLDSTVKNTSIDMPLDSAIVFNSESSADGANITLDPEALVSIPPGASVTGEFTAPSSTAFSMGAPDVHTDLNKGATVVHDPEHEGGRYILSHGTHPEHGEVLVVNQAWVDWKKGVGDIGIDAAVGECMYPDSPLYQPHAVFVRDGDTGEYRRVQGSPYVLQPTDAAMSKGIPLSQLEQEQSDKFSSRL